MGHRRGVPTPPVHAAPRHEPRIPTHLRRSSRAALTFRAAVTAVTRSFLPWI